MRLRLDPGIYVLATLTFFIDLIDVLIRIYLRHEHTVSAAAGVPAPTSIPLEIGQFTPYEAQLHLRPYAIVASVHNLDASSLSRFLENMAPFRHRLWVIDDGSTDDTWERLRDAGIRCVRGVANRKKPGAVKALLSGLPPSIESVMVIDPDIRIVNSVAEFEKILFEFQRSGMAAACPRISIRRAGILSRFQQLEYCLAFTLGRKALGDVSTTSGIALYRRDALHRALERHSLSVYAEDLENSLLLLVDGEQIYYDGRLVIETDGMATLKQLFSQRVGWSFGLIKVYSEHWRDLVKNTGKGFIFTYQYVVYIGILGLALHPLKLVGLALLIVSALNGADNLTGLHLIPDTIFTNEAYFAAMYLKYTFLIIAVMPLVTPRGDRRQILPILPFYIFYGIAQIIPATIGYLNWFSLRFWGRRVYRDHYQPVGP